MTARMDDGRRVGHRPDCRALRCRRQSRSPGTSDHYPDRLFLEVVIECVFQAIQSRTNKWQFGVLLVSFHRSVVRRVSIPATRRSFVCETAKQELAHHLPPSIAMLVLLVEVAVAVVGTPSLSLILVSCTQRPSVYMYRNRLARTAQCRQANLVYSITLRR